MKIRLFCAAGMSTSLLVTKMREAAKAMGIDADIEAAGETRMNEETEGCDVALLGPQIRFQLKKFREELAPMGIPVDVIEMADYGRMNGAAVLKKAMDLVQPK